MALYRHKLEIIIKPIKQSVYRMEWDSCYMYIYSRISPLKGTILELNSSSNHIFEGRFVRFRESLLAFGISTTWISPGFASRTLQRITKVGSLRLLHKKSCRSWAALAGPETKNGWTHTRWPPEIQLFFWGLWGPLYKWPHACFFLGVLHPTCTYRGPITPLIAGLGVRKVWFCRSKMMKTIMELCFFVSLHRNRKFGEF